MSIPEGWIKYCEQPPVSGDYPIDAVIACGPECWERRLYSKPPSNIKDCFVWRRAPQMPALPKPKINAGDVVCRKDEPLDWNHLWCVKRHNRAGEYAQSSRISCLDSDVAHSVSNLRKVSKDEFDWAYSWEISRIEAEHERQIDRMLELYDKHAPKS